MAQEILPKYKVTMQELYSIGALAIDNLTNCLADFGAYKAKYDGAFITALQLQLTNAKDMPSVEQRNVDHQTLLNAMVPLGEQCTGNMPKLMGYIEDGWPGENPKPRNEAAGYVMWKSAKAGDWENMSGMNDAMVNFITVNTATLTLPGGMPAAFAAKVSNDAARFNATYVLYKVARETNPAQQAKIKANNAFYDVMMAFMKEGVERVYADDKAKQDLFVLKKLKFIVSPPGSASLKVTVKKTDDSLVPAASVTIKAEGAVAMNGATDGNGVAFFDKVDPGIYAGSVNVGGAATQFVKEVDTGVDARITVVVG